MSHIREVAVAGAVGTWSLLPVRCCESFVVGRLGPALLTRLPFPVVAENGGTSSGAVEYFVRNSGRPLSVSED